MQRFKKTQTNRLHAMMREITLTKLCVSGCIINKSMTDPSSLKSTARPLKTLVIQADMSFQAFSWRVNGLNGVLEENSRLCGIIKDGDSWVTRVAFAAEKHFKVEERCGGGSRRSKGDLPFPAPQG